jgi:hypothetical protein
MVLHTVAIESLWRRCPVLTAPSSKPKQTQLDRGGDDHTTLYEVFRKKGQLTTKTLLQISFRNPIKSQSGYITVLLSCSSG